jgi:hypothetical protein
MPSIYGQRIYSANRYSWLESMVATALRAGRLVQDRLCAFGLGARDLCPGGLARCQLWPAAAPWEDPGDIEIALPGSGTIAGAVQPVGSISGKVGITGTIAGQVRPVGSLSGQRGIVGTITGAVSRSARSQASACTTPGSGHDHRRHRPVGSLQGKVLGPGHFVGILPQFGPIHYTRSTCPRIATQNDTESMDHLGVGAGATGLSRDRIPAGNVVWKFFVPDGEY